MNSSNHPFSANRTEEMGQDVWNTYVLPPYFNRLDLEARKSFILEGGRGCGKTALLRYLSFNSQFSKHRLEIPDSSLSTIGLYLKADSQYFSAFIGSNLNETQWAYIFEHSLSLALAEQVINSLFTLNSTDDRKLKFGRLDQLNFSDAVSGLSADSVPSDIDNFSSWLKTQRKKLSYWFRNDADFQSLEKIPLSEFLNSIINEIRQKLPYLEQSVFAVYIDEYENLLEYQQRFLNTLIKGGEPPLIFHIAMKPNGMTTRETLGSQSIQNVADFRRHKLDELLEPDFSLFAAELFFFRLIQQGGLPEPLSPISVQELRDLGRIDHRRSDPNYRQQVLEAAKRVLPGKKLSEISTLIFEDDILRKRWKDLVEDALRPKGSNLSAENFMDSQYPEASVVCAALLHQSKEPGSVLTEFEKLKNNQKSKFKNGDWIHHFLMGTLLLIYLPLRQRPCPIYAGFDAFVALSKPNVRHFLELCSRSVGSFDPTIDFETFNISIDDQAKAAFKVSSAFKEEVAGCGDKGNRLLSIVNFLGKLFRLSQGRRSQSEPERTHFCIVNNEASEEMQNILDEATKWSVFFEDDESKVKGTRYESKEYILNPIYAPFFGLSYNKGRKLELPYNDANLMLTGSSSDFSAMLKSYEKRWKIEGAVSEQYNFNLND